MVQDTPSNLLEYCLYAKNKPRYIFQLFSLKKLFLNMQPILNKINEGESLNIVGEGMKFPNNKFVAT